MNTIKVLGSSLFLAFALLGGCNARGSTINPPSATNTVTPRPVTILHSQTPAIPGVTPSNTYPYPVPLPAATLPYPYVPPEQRPGYQIVPTITMPPTSTITPTATVTLTATVTPTLTASATFPPYTGKPFTILFLRDGNLWLNEVGGKGERQLTHEPEGWNVTSYDFNPRGDRIAYATQKMEPTISDGLIKQLDLQSGETTPFFGEGDLLIEGSIRWLTDTLLAYKYDSQNYAWSNPTPTRGTTLDLDYGMHPLFYFLYDITTKQATLLKDTVAISPSPDRRYWVTCETSYPYEPNCKFVLYDLVAKQTWPVAQDAHWGWFLGWSPDRQWMLFSNGPGYSTIETNQKYTIVNTQTQIGKWVILPMKSHGSTAWASKSNVIAYSGCEGDETTRLENCQIQFWSPNGTRIKQPILLDRPFSILSWKQDDTRLLLWGRDSTLWIINVDGSGLQPILGGVPYPIVLSNDG